MVECKIRLNWTFIHLHFLMQFQIIDIILTQIILRSNYFIKTTHCCLIYYYKSYFYYSFCFSRSKFTVMKQVAELIKLLWYMLQTFFIPLDAQDIVYCDNEAVYQNVINPTSILSMKIHSISYHFCREAVISGTVQIAKEDIKTNLAGLFTCL